MNTPIDSSRSHTSHEEDLHKHDQHDGGPSGVAHIGHDAEEHHGEKPSMMKRVRARVRKMKDSITGHGHSHDHDHDEIHDDGEDDDDDEMDKDSEKHATHSSQSSMPGKDGVAMQHEPKLEGKTAAEGSPVSSKPGDYQTFDPTTARYNPGQDETSLGWSRTDTGKPNEFEEQPYNYAPKSSTPAVATHLGGGYNTGDSEIVKEGGHEKLGGLMGGPLGDHVEDNTHVPKGVREDHYPPNYQAKLTDPTSVAHSGGTHGLGDEERNVGKLGGVHGSPTHLENYRHVLDHSGEIRHGEDYEPAETDPTGKGGKEIGLTPVLHHLDRMNIHGEPRSQEESMFEPKDSPRDKKLSSGSHDQFFPEPVNSEERKYSETPHSGSQGLGDEGWHDKSEQKHESYAERASSAGAMMAGKHKQATGSVTPEQGYSGDSFDQQSPAVQGLHERHSEPGGYSENISIATAVVADKAERAKDVVATKLGYGATHEEQPVEGDSKGGSVVETLKGKIGYSMGSNVQGSGTQHEVGPTTTTTTDISGGTGKGVSMKEYLVEKLKPGEDDKALSEVITEALPLHKRKEDVSKAGEEEKKVPIKGRVTDSEEVATRLGRSEDTSHDEGSTPGKGVMERMMDAATSWYNKTDVSPTEDTKEGKE